MKFRSLILIAVVSLAACTARPDADVLRPVVTPLPEGAQEVSGLAVTTRGPVPGNPAAFGADRAARPSIMDYRVSIPPGHEPGQIEWAKDENDPEKHFVVRSQKTLAHADLARMVRGRMVGLYIHGFNTRYQEALFRAAQLSADAQIDGLPVLFTWPSAGSVGAYLADRDAADFSRAALADLLITLTRGRSASHPVPVLAHSMGARMTMETLVQLRLAGREDVLSRIDLILAAPDIDLDLFVAQMKTLGQMRHAPTVLVSSDDPALKISSRLASRRTRLGLVDVLDPEIQTLAVETGIRIVDITRLDSNDTAHSRYVGFLSGQRSAGVANPLEGVRSAGAFIFSGVGGVFQGIGSFLGD